MRTDVNPPQGEGGAAGTVLAAPGGVEKYALGFLDMWRDRLGAARVLRELRNSVGGAAYWACADGAHALDLEARDLVPLIAAGGGLLLLVGP